MTNRFFLTFVLFWFCEYLCTRSICTYLVLVDNDVTLKFITLGTFSIVVRYSLNMQKVSAAIPIDANKFEMKIYIPKYVLRDTLVLTYVHGEYCVSSHSLEEAYHEMSNLELQQIAERMAIVSQRANKDGEKLFFFLYFFFFNFTIYSLRIGLRVIWYWESR